MPFPLRRMRENTSSSKKRFLDDILSTHKKKPRDLPKRYLVIRINIDFLKYFLKTHHWLMSLVAFFLIIGISGFLSGFARASIATFYPTTCLGSWEHPENVQGEPSLPTDAPASDFNLSNSAHMKSSSGALYCGGFKGEIPNNTKPIHFKVSFHLSVDDGSVIHKEPEPFGNIPTAPVIIPPDTITKPSSSPAPSTPSTTNGTDTTLKSTDAAPTPSSADTSSGATPSNVPNKTEIPTSAPASTPAPTTTPVVIPAKANTQSFLFTPTAFAKDVIVPSPVATTPTSTAPPPPPSPAPDVKTSHATTDPPPASSDTTIPPVTTGPVTPAAKSDSSITPAPTEAPPKTVTPTNTAPKDSPTASQALSDQFLEVSYTLDGTTWNTLGSISRSSWQSNSFDIPTTEWTSLDHLQISVKTLPIFDDPSTVFMDSMKISVEYNDIPKLMETPTVILKDSSNIISSDKNDFSPNEQPKFIITNPNLNTSDIKILVGQNKAEVVNDPNGDLNKPTESKTETVTPNTI